jgi:arsenate reductase
LFEKIVLASFGLFGWRIALIYMSMGLLIPMVTGMIIGRLNMENQVEDWVYEIRMGQTPALLQNISWMNRIDYGLHQVRDIVGKVWIYIILGIGAGAASHGYVPEGFLAALMGKQAWWSGPAAVLLGAPLYSNACRSQMAEGLVNHDLAGQVRAWSAGVRDSRINPRAIQVMAELGIDISGHRAKSVHDLAGEAFDLVVTVCGQAQQQCPIFSGDTEVMHAGFPDPAKATGTEEEVMAAFRQVRDGMRAKIIPLLRQKAGAG